MRLALFLLSGMTLLLTVPAWCGPPQEPKAGATKSSLAKVLNAPDLWGKDLAVALAHLPHWKRLGEARVIIFSDYVVGTTAYQSPEAARKALEEHTGAIKKPRPNPEFASLLKQRPGSKPSELRSKVVTPVPVDSTLRIAWGGTVLRFFSPELSEATVRKRLGPPEKVTEEIQTGDREGRPVVLKQYHYAGGSVIFAESDWTPMPGLIDRVIIDVPALEAVLYQVER